MTTSIKSGIVFGICALLMVSSVANGQGKMKTFSANGATLEYMVRGAGEPLLLIHGAMVADSFEPIADHLAAAHQLITYRRRGYGGTPPHEVSTISKHAADAVALLDHLKIDVAHVGGHSFGAMTALQIAIDSPQRVHSLALLEPLLPDAASASEFGSRIATVVELYQSGKYRGALERMLSTVGGPDPLPRLNATLSDGWFEQTLGDFTTSFGADAAAVKAWEFRQENAATISKPTLTLVGSETEPIFAETGQLLSQWLPNAEQYVVDGATHLLHWEDPEGVAAGLLAFLSRHPMS